ncbi:MAG: MutH/Sau3AI family endonuclease, partial [bacterium]
MPFGRKPIGYSYADAENLLAQALTLEGVRAKEVAVEVDRTAFNATPKPVGRTGVGNLTQLYMGRKEDNRREPDFPELGIELKTLPMKALRRGNQREWTVKEPTSITMIDYREVDQEDWSVAYLRHKIDHILWVPYEHDYGDKRESRFRRAFLWKPDAADYPVFGIDYDVVRGYIQRDDAEHLSETLSQVLAARRKGSKGQMAEQPRGPPAKSRAWAFKAAYTRPILDKHVLGRIVPSLATEVPRIRTLLDVEPFVTNRLARYDGKPLREIGRATGGAVAGGKAGPAGFVRQLLGVKQRGPIEEFEKLGIRIHTVWARPSDLAPWEAVSFPA